MWLSCRRILISEISGRGMRAQLPLPRSRRAAAYSVLHFCENEVGKRDQCLQQLNWFGFRGNKSLFDRVLEAESASTSRTDHIAARHLQSHHGVGWDLPWTDRESG